MNQPRLGVVVGRFQSPYLHAGYIDLLSQAGGHNDELLIVVGSSGGAPCAINPYDFATRRLMLLERFPSATIVEQRDQQLDTSWSRSLDAKIYRLFPDHEVTLYGSRHSFIGSYSGEYRTSEIRARFITSATSIRESRGNTPTNHVQFMDGVLYARKHSFPVSYQAVDLVLSREWDAGVHVGHQVLVGRKTGEDLWRFPGGFVDPEDQSLEAAIRREAKEELGDIEISDPAYIGSFRTNCYRYRKSQHKLMTALYSAQFIYGRLVASDDLAEIQWVPVSQLLDSLYDGHRMLGKAYLATLKQPTTT